MMIMMMILSRTRSLCRCGIYVRLARIATIPTLTFRCGKWFYISFFVHKRREQGFGRTGEIFLFLKRDVCLCYGCSRNERRRPVSRERLTFRWSRVKSYWRARRRNNFTAVRISLSHGRDSQVDLVSVRCQDRIVPRWTNCTCFRATVPVLIVV